MPRADYNELAQSHDDRGTPSAPLLAGLALEQRVPIYVEAVMSSRKAPSSSGHECAAGDAGCTRTLHFVVVSFCAGSLTVPCQRRHHRNAAAIFLINLLLGWTVLGWIAALVWSVTADVQKPSLGSKPDL
jgi:Superinfection immunity protein